MTFAITYRCRRMALAAAVFWGTMLLYLPSARYSFVDYDDQEYVIENPHMRAGLTWENVKWAFMSAGYADNWHPLAWISMMVDVSLAGSMDDETWNRRDNRAAHVMHLHNVLLHAANAALLFWLLGTVGRGEGEAVGSDKIGQTCFINVAIAMLWAVHPLRCEVVCWCSERKELLSVFFMLLTLLAWVGGNGFKAFKAEVTAYIFAFGFYALALMAKPLAVSLPTVLFAYDWILGKGKRLRTANYQLPTINSILKILPFVAMSLVCCFLTMASQNVSRASGAEQFVCQRLESFFVAPLIYIRQTLWPSGLSSFYKLTFSMDWLGVTLGALLVAAIVWVCVRWLRRREQWAAIVAFGVSWVYVGLLPMLGIGKVGPQEHADRYTYWVGCGVCVVAAMSLQYFLGRRGEREKEELKIASGKLTIGVEAVGKCGCARNFTSYIVYSTVFVLLALAFVTRGRMGAWRDTISLMRDSLPKSWYGENAGILASHLEATGNPDDRREAEMWLRSTVEYRATPAACGELALFLSHQKHPKIGFGNESPYEEARYLAHRSLAGCKEQAVAWEALGNCDAAEEKWEDAIGNFEKALPHSKRPELVRKKIEICRGRAKGKGRG